MKKEKDYLEPFDIGMIIVLVSFLIIAFGFAVAYLISI